MPLPRRDRLTAGAAQTVFTFTFPVTPGEEDTVLVTVYDTSAGAVVLPMDFGTDYSVNLTTSEITLLTFVPDAGDVVTIESLDIAPIRFTDFAVSLNNFRPEVVDAEFDNFLFEIQDLGRDRSRSARLAPEVDADNVSVILPIPAASTPIGWNAAADGIENLSVINAATAFRAADGSVSVPSFSFIDDTDTGFWRSASGQVSLSLNGVDAHQFGDREYIIQSANGAYIEWFDEGGTANQRKFDIQMDGDTINFNVKNDAGTRGHVFRISRTGPLVGDNDLFLNADRISVSEGGSAAAPSFGITTDNDTGLYSPGANQFGIATGGVSAFTIDAAQVVTVPGDLVVLGTLTATISLSGLDLDDDEFIEFGTGDDFDIGYDSVADELQIRDIANSPLIQITQAGVVTLAGNLNGATIIATKFVLGDDELIEFGAGTDAAIGFNSATGEFRILGPASEELIVIDPTGDNTIELHGRVNLSVGGGVASPQLYINDLDIGLASGGSGSIELVANSLSLIRLASGSVLVNNLQGDVDFRIKGVVNDFLFMTDASADRVGFGLAPTDGLVHIQSASAGAVVAALAADELVIEGSSNAGISILTPDASSSIIYFGSPTNSVGASMGWQYSTLKFGLGPNTAGGILELYSDASTLAMTIDASQRVGINTASPNQPLEVLHNGSTGGIRLHHPFNTVNNIQRFEFTALNSAAATVQYSYIDSRIIVNTAGAHEGHMRMSIANAGTLLEYLRLDGNAKKIHVNTFNNAAIDFHIGGSADTALFFADSDTGRIGIGTLAPAVSAKLDITSTTGALLPPRMTTTQRDALTATNGMIIYNTTVNQMQGRINGAWAAM